VSTNKSFIMVKNEPLQCNTWYASFDAQAAHANMKTALNHQESKIHGLHGLSSTVQALAQPRLVNCYWSVANWHWQTGIYHKNRSRKGMHGWGWLPVYSNISHHLHDRPLLHFFGKTGSSTSPNFCQVLTSNFHLSMVCNPYGALLLCHLYQLARVQDIPLQSVEEYTMDWQKTWEATSSSPLGLHCGHYMARTFN